MANFCALLPLSLKQSKSWKTLCVQVVNEEQIFNALSVSSNCLLTYWEATLLNHFYFFTGFSLFSAIQERPKECLLEDWWTLKIPLNSTHFVSSSTIVNRLWFSLKVMLKLQRRSMWQKNSLNSSGHSALRLPFFNFKLYMLLAPLLILLGFRGCAGWSDKMTSKRRDQPALDIPWNSSPREPN